MITEAMNRAFPVQTTGAHPFELLRATQKCQRCGGLLVVDHCLDLLNSTGQSAFLAMRCVQCGDIIDPVILQHRHRKVSVSPSTVRSEEEPAAPVVGRRAIGRRAGTTRAAGCSGQCR